ncbi:MAG: PIN domain-containing protein [Acidobacteriaceae bacterium]|nr:PIN domain-containing protein [Acidobacteriaceae bacterium]
MTAFLDANIVIDAFADFADPRKHSIARDLAQSLSADGECIVSPQVLKEFANVCTRRLRGQLSEEVILQLLRQLSRIPSVETTATLILAAVRRHFANRISFYDALIIEAAIAGGADVLYTEDLQHGQVFDGLRIVNPFL